MDFIAEFLITACADILIGILEGMDFNDFLRIGTFILFVIFFTFNLILGAIIKYLIKCTKIVANKCQLSLVTYVIEKFELSAGIKTKSFR